MLEISTEAAEVLERALAAATRFNKDVRIRVYRRGAQIETGFADTPEPGDTFVAVKGFSVIVAPEVGDGTLTVSEEHERLIVR